MIMFDLLQFSVTVGSTAQSIELMRSQKEIKKFLESHSQQISNLNTLKQILETNFKNQTVYDFQSTQLNLISEQVYHNLAKNMHDLAEIGNNILLNYGKNKPSDYKITTMQKITLSLASILSIHSFVNTIQAFIEYKAPQLVQLQNPKEAFGVALKKAVLRKEMTNFSINQINQQTRLELMKQLKENYLPEKGPVRKISIRQIFKDGLSAVKNSSASQILSTITKGFGRVLRVAMVGVGIWQMAQSQKNIQQLKKEFKTLKEFYQPGGKKDQNAQYLIRIFGVLLLDCWEILQDAYVLITQIKNIFLLYSVVVPKLNFKQTYQLFNPQNFVEGFNQKYIDKVRVLALQVYNYSKASIVDKDYPKIVDSHVVQMTKKIKRITDKNAPDFIGSQTYPNMMNNIGKKLQQAAIKLTITLQDSNQVFENYVSFAQNIDQIFIQREKIRIEGVPNKQNPFDTSKKQTATVEDFQKFDQDGFRQILYQYIDIYINPLQPKDKTYTKWLTRSWKVQDFKNVIKKYNTDGRQFICNIVTAYIGETFYGDDSKGQTFYDIEIKKLKSNNNQIPSIDVLKQISNPLPNVILVDGDGEQENPTKPLDKKEKDGDMLSVREFEQILKKYFGQKIENFEKLTNQRRYYSLVTIIQKYDVYEEQEDHSLKLIQKEFSYIFPRRCFIFQLPKNQSLTSYQLIDNTKQDGEWKLIELNKES